MGVLLSSRVQSFRLIAGALLLLVVSASVGPAAPAGALSRAAVICGYGVSYGQPVRHHCGVDLRAAAGDPVTTPVAGTVTFLGRVPGAGNRPVQALTLRTTVGDLITFSPLTDVTVDVGVPVVAGTTVAVLAASGDPSASVTHLHVSLRRAGHYLDPASLLSGVLPEALPTEQPVPAPTALSDTASPVKPQGAASAAVMPRAGAVRVPTSVGADDAFAAPAVSVAPARAAAVAHPLPVMLTGLMREEARAGSSAWSAGSVAVRATASAVSAAHPSSPVTFSAVAPQVARVATVMLGLIWCLIFSVLSARAGAGVISRLRGRGVLSASRGQFAVRGR